jgi:hypothetical protein
MKTKILLCKLMLLLLPLLPYTILHAQAPAVKHWDKSFGGSKDDFSTSIQQTSDGGYIAGGYSYSGRNGDKTQFGRGGSDYWIVKMDRNGNKQWDKTFGGSSDDELHWLQQTSDGGHILGGHSLSGISGDKTEKSRGFGDYWVIKIDASGKKQWDKTFGGSDDDFLNSLQQTSDGGYILGGTSSSPRSGDKSQNTKGLLDYWIVKIDANGNKLWDRTFGGNGDEFFASLRQTSDGGYLLGGDSDSGISGDKTDGNKGITDYWIVKINAHGNKEWDKTFGGNSVDQLASLQQTKDGGYILSGISASRKSGDKTQYNRGSYDYWIVKTNALGEKLWDKTFGGDEVDYFPQVQQTSDGGYIVGGFSLSTKSGDKTEPNIGGYDFWIVKTDMHGNKEWDETLGGTEDDHLTSLQQTTDGGYILGGGSRSGNNGDKTQISRGGQDYWVVKLCPRNNQLSSQEANDVVAQNSAQRKDAIAGTSPVIKLFPNPTKGQFKIELYLSENINTNAKIELVNNRGQTVSAEDARISNGVLQKNVTISSSVSSGIYIARVIIHDQAYQARLVYEK